MSKKNSSLTFGPLKMRPLSSPQTSGTSYPVMQHTSQRNLELDSMCLLFISIYLSTDIYTGIEYRQVSFYMSSSCTILFNAI